ncbi:MAG TPA: HAMP domain-containing sensor histidine kinase, partial [Polyangium sp.]|nr:HAMP domain-containing sensor histidine kinase [Polyangium sp.]
MNTLVQQFNRSVLARQLLTGLGGHAAIAVLGPTLLVLDRDTTNSVLVLGLKLTTLTILINTLACFWQLHALGRLFLGTPTNARRIGPSEVRRLLGLPSVLTFRFFAVICIVHASGLLPILRPEKLDQGRAISLFILSVTILGACSLIHYILVRTATVRVLDVGPIELVASFLESQELQQIPRRRLLQKFLLAVVAPVALVGVGAVLITHARMREQLEKSQAGVAYIVAQLALESGVTTGKNDTIDNAVGALMQYDFLVQPAESNHRGEPIVTRQNDGELVLTAIVASKEIDVRFKADLDPTITTEGVVVALVFCLIAAIMGALVGRALSEDLLLATHRVRLLGTESVLRGETQIARPVRFSLVANLGRAIEVLAERFRIFAGAQERALEVQEAAQRMRGLLFASVSHDLKSPLNAILGFAELVSREELTTSQRESLTLIENRGRELLGLIESILDTARVEAGQLTLLPRSLPVAQLATESVRRARDLAPDAHQEVIVEVAEGLPDIPFDPAYSSRAFALIIGHAIRTSHADP